MEKNIHGELNSNNLPNGQRRKSKMHTIKMNETSCTMPGIYCIHITSSHSLPQSEECSSVKLQRKKQAKKGRNTLSIFLVCVCGRRVLSDKYKFGV